MKAIIVITVTLSFIWLSYASLHRQDEGYTKSVFSVLDKPQKPQWDKRQAAIAEVWNITPEEVAQPVNIFGKE